MQREDIVFFHSLEAGQLPLNYTEVEGRKCHLDYIFSLAEPASGFGIGISDIHTPSQTMCD